MEKPLVGLIIGNIPGARERNNPDINWVPALAVQTRAQAKREGVTSKLKTPSIIDRTITPAQVSNAQKDDDSHAKFVRAFYMKVRSTEICQMERAL